jgi:hypothetical protein
MRQSLADATGRFERREAIVRVSFAASFPRASSCRIQAPIVFEIGVLAGVLSRWDCMGQRQGICRRNIQPKVTGIRSRIARVFDGGRIRRIVLAIPESRQAEDLVAVRAGGISAKGNRKQFEGAFLLLESETVNAAEKTPVGVGTVPEVGSEVRRAAPSISKSRYRYRTVAMLSLVRSRLSERSGLAAT